MIETSNNDYVKSRTDMLEIKKRYGKNFFVAEGENNEILGTVGFLDKPEITHFKGVKIENKSWEMFSMCVKHSARRLGIAQKMLSDLERRAKEEGIKLIVFEATTPQYPAIKFYKKCGYDWELHPFPTIGRTRFLEKQFFDFFIWFSRMKLIRFYKEL
ncbi:Oidioi.mRNA.OKI2018_I69.chr1.g3388.t1.cds [Oikopleura dioica]|uniref:Oidioi.mRNA.OKI2018_I69.chr1.g3388.t1.cds n=1 Tax=Oikopleura dioica TaxID=34765 RepID=A0ABN7SZD2_OIKDI|nr:Oidioi.mRNA.OKI2018_I69.chr1.g3388.t1.cds [Oikopleura dioica]